MGDGSCVPRTMSLSGGKAMWWKSISTRYWRKRCSYGKQYITASQRAFLYFVRACWRTAPVIFGLSFAFRKIARIIYRTVRKGITGVNTSLSENISGVKLTQIFNQEDRKLNEFDEKNN